MKYMGSKRTLLQNGLGTLICNHAQDARRVVDLFCGSGVVAWFAARETTRPVLAADLQNYAVILARSVIGRNHLIRSDRLEEDWLNRVRRARAHSKHWRAACYLAETTKNIHQLVDESRKLCDEVSTIGPVWNAYGGHYFSPIQALTFDYMLKYLPTREPERSICLAAAISAASKCAAAPGHTAQPFQPTRTAGKFVREAWQRDPILFGKKGLDEICPQHANTTGETVVSDAIKLAATLRPDDLVIVDPPYSGVHYSRFYHVLETIAKGQCSSVDGVGRYPPIEERPQSEFSNKGQAKSALERLLSSLAVAGATVIFTFPNGECSNGLSGRIVVETASAWFHVEKRIVTGQFSTLGGNNTHRDSRKSSSELLLLLKSK